MNNVTLFAILIVAFLHRSTTDDCVEFENWSFNQIRESNSSARPDLSSPVSPKESEWKSLKPDSKEMQEFLFRYQQFDNSRNSRCYNDTKCVYFGDCCPDKHQYSLDKTYEFYKCFEIYTDDSLVNYALVSRCAPFLNKDSDTKEKCEHWDTNPDYPPVTTNDVGRSYRNEFCAKCNGDWNFTKWHAKVAFKDFDFDWFDQITHIRNLSDVTDFMKNIPSINVFTVQPVGISKPWICNEKIDYIEKCNVTGLMLSFESWEQVGCHSYSSPVGLFRNVFCERCNLDAFCPYFAPSPKLPVSFGALMDVTALQKYEHYLKEKEKKSSCQLDEFYDYLNMRCRCLYCSLGLYLTPNSSCSYIMTSAHNIIYKIHFSLIPQSGGITEKEALLVQDKVLETTIKVHTLIVNVFEYQPNYLTNHKSPRVVDKMLFYVHFKKAKSEFVEMEKEIKTLFFEVRHACFLRSFRIVKDLESFEFSEDLISPTSTKRAILYSDIRSCPKVKLSSKEFTLNEDNLVISIRDRRVNLTVDRVEFHPNGTAMICLSDYPGSLPDLESPTPDIVEIILSTVFLGISLLCLAITLATYAIFSELRTLPGKCNIFLCCTLFIAQALFLLGAYDNEIVCTVIGSMRHFAWLSTFGWLGVCSFHMHRVFTHLLVGNDRNANKILAKYALTAYSLPLVVVGGTVIANMALYGVRVTGYGLPNCFLSQELQLILAFILPLSLMVIFNTTLLSITIYSLIKTTKQCKMVNRDKQRVIVYLKLSSLSGITWFFGFLSMSFSHSWLTYIFIVTNASQGIYLFLSYTLNAKVLKLYAFKFPCLPIPIRHQRTPSVYTSETVSTTSTSSRTEL